MLKRSTRWTKSWERHTNKLSETKEKVFELEKVKEQNKKLSLERDQMATVIAEMRESLEIKTKQNSALISENEMLNGKIKELGQDNALYFKKIMDLQGQIVEKMNDANQLYEEAKTMKQESILKKNDEFGMSDGIHTYGIDMKISDNYFSVPSRTKYKIFAHSKEATWLSYSSQGTAIATGGGDGVIKIWDVEQGKEIGSLTKQKKSITCLAFTPDDQYLISCSLDRSIKLWKIQTLRDALSFTGHSDTINTCKVNYAAKCLITGSSDRTIRLWDFHKGIATKTFPCTSSCFTLDTLPSQTEIVSGHLDGSIKFWCSKNEEKIHEMKDLHADAVTSVTLTMDGNYVLTNSRDHSIKLIDVRKYEEVAKFDNEMYINGSDRNRAWLNSSAKYGAVGSRQGNLIVFEIKSGSILLEEIYTNLHSSSVNAVEWQPGASSFSSIDSSGSLFIWE